MGRFLHASARTMEVVRGAIQLRTHRGLFLEAYNHARRLKTLRILAPHEFVCKNLSEGA